MAANELLKRTTIAAKATAAFTLGAGLVFMLMTVLTILENPQRFWRLSLFTALLSVIFVIIGLLYLRLALRKTDE